MNRAKGKWAALNGVDVCRGESQRDGRGVEIMRVVGIERRVYKTVLQGSGCGFTLCVGQKSSHSLSNEIPQICSFHLVKDRLL